MKIFSAEQLKAADKETMKKQNISSVELMERAGKLIFEEIHARMEKNKRPVKVFCGIGNNGGDGLVIARHLIQHLYDVKVYIVNYSDNRSSDFLKNYDRIKDVTKEWPVLLRSDDDLPELAEEDVVIDALFGVGLNRELDEWVKNLVLHINKSQSFVISVDVPSGMFCDEPTRDKNAVIAADFTFTFQSPKMAFFLPETGRMAGQFEVLDIGLDKEFLQNTETETHLIRKNEARLFYKPRENFTHKGTYGHALLIGGSYGKMGSISLTATAAMKSGAGMATVFVPKCGYEIIQTLLPEAMVITDKAEDFISEIAFDLKPAVIGFGVGVGKKDETLQAFGALLERTEKPMVIDADGLNLLAANKELLKKLPKNSILTPHPKELERLMGGWDDDFEKLEKAREFVKEYDVVLLIKGSRTITVTKDNYYINSTGNAGMATAGSGDVLTGVITGLVSQGYDPLTAAVFGVYLHGSSGDLAAKEMSEPSLLAGDIAKYLGAAFLDLEKMP
ncbi:NAD(P)H-hydrate dehydratase [Salinimicrobium sp. GXAS 041]|uniref:NAD(P)H-hydrate dehydratase n=1 Tax=Salinimicrobium sp. GXAS 041 TaxID=3400806 RepID=UPI003C736923